MNTVVVLIATMMFSGYHEYGVVHVEHDYPSFETCEIAYKELYKQAHDMKENAAVVGKCLKVK